MTSSRSRREHQNCPAGEEEAGGESHEEEEEAEESGD
jgi:hypothetical protein